MSHNPEVLASSTLSKAAHAQNSGSVNSKFIPRSSYSSAYYIPNSIWFPILGNLCISFCVFALLIPNCSENSLVLCERKNNYWRMITLEFTIHHMLCCQHLQTHLTQSEPSTSGISDTYLITNSPIPLLYTYVSDPSQCLAEKIFSPGYFLAQSLTPLLQKCVKLLCWMWLVPLDND